jgi:pimeloyl-ACP methyl ester carboxylesterase
MRTLLVFLLTACCAFGQSPEERTRQALDQLLARKFTDFYATFSPQMKQAISLETFSAQMEQIVALGAPQKIDAPRTTTVGENSVVVIGVHWAQVSLDFQVAWSKGGEVAGAYWRPGAAPASQRPQEPKPPFPYRAEEVTFESHAGAAKLAGTLTIPDGKGPFPAAILLSGSGPNDRNEAVFGHKPFLVLADYLTRHGIAVLRYDKRGIRKPRAEFLQTTPADFADDAEGAFDYLKARPEIDPKAIGLIGHSEGGLEAPMVAARRPDVRFVVLLAGPGVRATELLKAQAAKLARASGAAESAIEQNAQLQDKIFRILTDEKNDQAAREKIVAAMGGLPTAQAEAEQDASPWFRFFVFYDPAPTIEKTKCPVLALNGELDLQVPPEQNLPAIEAALTKGGNKDFETMKLAGLNHLLQTAKTGSVMEYSQIEETMSPVALDEVASWIAARTRR